MPYKDYEVQKVYYSIGEVAKMFDVSRSLIRFWEKEFDTIKPRKNRKGNRLFTKKDLEALELIYHLVKEKGYTLDGAKKQIKSQKDQVDDHFDMIQSLKKIRTFLVDLKGSPEEEEDSQSEVA